MNTQEFKAWFSGFTEEMTGVPSEIQWTRIKEEIVRLTVITEGVSVQKLMAKDYAGNPDYWKAKASST